MIDWHSYVLFLEEWVLFIEILILSSDKNGRFAGVQQGHLSVTIPSVIVGPVCVPVV